MKESSEISFEKLFDMALLLGNKIDTYWNLFFVGNFGFVAFTSNITLADRYRLILLSFLYVGFMAINMITAIRGYVLLNLALTELRAASGGITFRHDRVASRIAKFRLRYRVTMTIIVYIVSAIGVLSLFWR
jgi:hypothetical protein